MKSENTSIVVSSLQEHIRQVLEQSNSIDEKVAEIDTLIKNREDVLTILLNEFEAFITEWEKVHPRNDQWHKTIATGKKYLKQYSK